MLQPNPIKRYKLKEIREHEWFKINEVPQYLRIWEKEVDCKLIQPNVDQ